MQLKSMKSRCVRLLKEHQEGKIKDNKRTKKQKESCLGEADDNIWMCHLFETVVGGFLLHSLIKQREYIELK